MAAPATNQAQSKGYDTTLGSGRIDKDLPVGSAASLLLHAGFVVAALFTWQNTPRIMPDEVIAVDIVSDVPSGVGNAQGQNTPIVGTDTAEPNPLPQPLEAAPSPVTPTPPQPAPLPPEAVAETPAPAPQPTIAPVPALQKPPPPAPPKAIPTKPTPAKSAPKPLPPPPPPAPAPAPQAKRQPSPQPAAKVQPKTQAKVQPKVQSKSPPTAAARPGRTPNEATTPPEFDLAAASSAASGADSGGRRSPQLSSKGQAGRQGASGGGTQLTGDLEAALRAQIKECWLEPADMSNPRSLLVEVNIELGVDGRLLRDPVLVTPSSRVGANASLAVAIDNALRAVRQCAPFNLPADRYETWRKVRFSFDPRRMTRP